MCESAEDDEAIHERFFETYLNSRYWNICVFSAQYPSGIKKKKKCFKKFNIKVLADTVRTHYYSILNRTVVPFLFYSLPSVRALLRPGEPLLNVLILPF